MADTGAPGGGTALSHPEKDPLPILVAPTTEVTLNTIKAFLVPVGCWRVDDLRFAFDSSVVHPEIKTEMGLLATLRLAHPGAPMSIFGHADPTGDDTYNKVLSGRRATAIYALLTRDIDKWEKLFSSPFGGDNWGMKSIQLMLNEVTGTSLVVDGVNGSQTGTAIGDYRESKGMSRSNSADKSTRAKLFADYMDAVCVDSAGKKYQLQKSEFLAKGADPDGKGDFQGCSEFNPFLVFSTDEAAKFQSDHKTRDSENAPNRRVMALLFKPGTVISTSRWPCPKASEGIAGCKARFWSDGEERRNPQDERRTFDDTKDTYGCRFYHRLFVLSPCGAGSGQAPAVVMQIKPSILGTKGVRDPKKRRPKKDFDAVSSTITSLKDNKPVILVQGCNDVDLEAVISGPSDVSWTVTPTENTNAAPTLTVDGTSANKTKAKLSSAQQGSFSVIASIGTSRVVWNVVFVSVVVDPERAVVTLRDNLYVDNGSDKDVTAFRSGEFNKVGQYPWEITINNVTLTGGGADQKLGIDQVELHALQNGIEDTLSGHYQGGATVLEQPKIAGPGLPRLPVTDSNGDAAANPFGDANKIPVVTPNQTDAIRTWSSGDSPTGAFARAHNGKLMFKVDGVNGFRTAVASFSKAAPDAIVVHCETSWKADFTGDVATGKIATYTANGAQTISDKAVALISPATNGQDAGEAGFDTFEPRFNNGTEKIFS